MAIRERDMADGNRETRVSQILSSSSICENRDGKYRSENMAGLGFETLASNHPSPRYEAAFSYRGTERGIILRHYHRLWVGDEEQHNCSRIGAQTERELKEKKLVENALNATKARSLIEDILRMYNSRKQGFAWRLYQRNTLWPRGHSFFLNPHAQKV